MLAGQNGPCGRPPRGRTYTCTVEVLNVVPLGGRLPRLGLRELLAPGHSFEPPAGDAPARFSLQTKSAGCCGEAFYNGRHANASQSPVLPRARLAYDACLNAGSTAVLAHGHHSETGALTRSCTELIRLPSECIARNALRALKIVVPRLALLRINEQYMIPYRD